MQHKRNKVVEVQTDKILKLQGQLSLKLKGFEKVNSKYIYEKTTLDMTQTTAQRDKFSTGLNNYLLSQINRKNVCLIS